MKQKFKELERISYIDGYFGAGTMTGSAHPENDFYLDINGDISELTRDEITAIASVITGALWNHCADGAEASQSSKREDDE